MKNFIHTSLSIVGIFLICGFPPAVANEEAPNEPKPSDKIHVIYTSGGSDASGGGVVVSKVTISDFNGVKCLSAVGLIDYMKGITVYIPIDKIAMIIEYNDEESWIRSTQDYAKLEAELKKQNKSEMATPKKSSD